MILEALANHAKERVVAAKKIESLESIRTRAYALGKGDFIFEKVLKAEGSHVICEIKKASPSKGIISEAFPYIEIAKEYERIGASCISCLTEPKWFLGSDEIFKAIREVVKVPMLRKDFTVDAYQLYEAKCMGAECVLLIVSLLSDVQLSTYLEICEELGLSALVETHDATEIERAIRSGARMIGVNNRNLKNFKVDVNHAANLRALVPKELVFVAESGIQTPHDLEPFKSLGVNGVLVGEAMMRASDKRALLQSFQEVTSATG